MEKFTFITLFKPLGQTIRLIRKRAVRSLIFGGLNTNGFYRQWGAAWLLLASFVSVFIVPHTVIANVITVNTTNDEVDQSADCSLREAVISANTDTAVDGCGTGSGADEIVFAPEVVPGIFILAIVGSGEDAAATGDLDITDDLTISGAGASNTVIDADQIDRAFHIIGSVTVHLEELTIQNGFVSVPNNIAGGGGGIIVEGGNLDMKNCIVSGNTADFGGGILNEAGVMNILECTIAGNTAVQSGAGISNRAGALQITDSTIYDNHTGPAPSEGGGIRNNFGGTIRLTNSTVGGNSSQFGGGIVNDSGSMVIINSTVSENLGNNSAGGIGIDSGSVELQNSIVANNSAEFRPDCAFFGLAVSLGNNLIGDNTGCELTPGPDDIIPEPGAVVDPRLGPFIDTEAPGKGYFPLLSDSPAIDAANDEACPDTDQLGNSRSDGDDDGMITCDIGAIEFQTEELTVQIDIDPRHERNFIAPRSKGLIWVAVLSDSNFDPSHIQISTVRFGPDGAKAIRHKSKDLNRDGTQDLLLLFRIRATGISCGDTEVTLTGETVDGLRFSGMDDITTVGCYSKNNRHHAPRLHSDF
jgi:CSLREA domain-containing protein